MGVEGGEKRKERRSPFSDKIYSIFNPLTRTKPLGGPSYIIGLINWKLHLNTTGQLYDHPDEEYKSSYL